MFALVVAAGASSAAATPASALNRSFNFGTAATPTASTSTLDSGAAYTAGVGYGWVREDSLGSTPVPADASTYGRLRGILKDKRVDSFIGMQPTPADATKPNVAWVYDVPNGQYDVTVAVGDAGNFTDSSNVISVEGTKAVNQFVPVAASKFRFASVTVDVTDGQLTVDARTGSNTKIDYLTVETAQTGFERPSIGDIQPANGATLQPRDRAVTAEVRLVNVGGGVDETTLTDANVKLERVSDGFGVPIVVNTSGGGDVIVAQPHQVLDANTQYRFLIGDGVKDTTGASFKPAATTFTTDASTPTASSLGAFSREYETTSFNRYGTSIVVGPDHRLYSGSLDGRIYRYPIAPNGTLGIPTSFTTVRDHEGEDRHIIGLAFDPASTVENPILWVSHSYATIENSPDWEGKVSRLSGPDLENIQDYVTQLPRSVKDHESNSLAFGPDGALYLSQGSNSAAGAPDTAWGLRQEHQLNAAILRIDTAAITSPPLDVKTAEGGVYNAFAPDAPVTIYADGIRNAYDLVFHSNGQLYSAVNGTAAGGNTPASPATLPAACADRLDFGFNGAFTTPAIPAANNIVVQPDLLLRVVKGGFYGHPNPSRCEYSFFGGNPTTGQDPQELATPNSSGTGFYPPGTPADRNFRKASLDLGLHFSPDGMIEYKSNSFNGALKGMLLVVRYSAGDDVVALQINPTTKEIQRQIVGIPGLNNLTDPLDIAEDTTNGNLYVTELGAGRISLLRPEAAGAVNTNVTRIDVGSTADTVDSSGNVWKADTGFFTPSNLQTGGNAATAISGTDDDQIYATNRASTGSTTPLANRVFEYAVPVTGSIFDIKLLFSESYWTAENKRRFDGTIEGIQKITNFDIYKLAGGKDAALTRLYTGVSVTDGVVNIKLSALADFPSLSGIEITCRADCTAPTTPPSTTPTTPTTTPTTPATTPEPTTPTTPTTTPTTPATTPEPTTPTTPTTTPTTPATTPEPTTPTTPTTTPTTPATTPEPTTPTTPTTPATTPEPTTPTTPTTPPASTPPSVTRIDVGSSVSTVDSAGNTWQPDTGLFSPTNTAAGGSTATAIAGTTDDNIFGTNRSNMGSSTPQANRVLSYAIPTTATQVSVKLLFSESYWTAANKRRMDIYAENVKAISSLDIYASAGGKDTAHTRTISPVNIVGGVLDLRFAALADMPIVSGIEVTCLAGCPVVAPTTPIATTPTTPATTPTTPATTPTTPATTPTTPATTPTTPPASTPPSVTRIDVGSTVATTDTAGNTWQPDTGLFSPANTAAGGTPTTVVAGTTDDNIFGTNRSNMGSSTPQANRSLNYTIPTSATQVSVKLLFTESYWTAANKRRMDIYAEGVKAISSLDIYAAAPGKDVAHTRTINPVTIAGGALELRFQALADMPIVSGIEITCLAGCPVVAPTTPIATTPTTPTTTPTTPATTPTTPATTPTTPATTPTTPITTPTTPVSQAIRIDAGSSVATTDQFGNTWQSDSGLYSPANAAAEGTPSDPIAGTNDGNIVATNRGNVGSSTSQANRFVDYAIPTVYTKVDVSLFFAERYWTVANKRKQNVIAEGVTAISGLDIAALAPGKDRALVRTLANVTVADGTLNLRFQATTDMPLISGIEVTCVEGCGPPPTGLGTASVVNTDAGAPADRVVLSRIAKPEATPQSENVSQTAPADLWGVPASHMDSIVRVSNTGNGPMVVTGVQFTGDQYFTLINPPTFPLTLSKNSSIDLTVELIRTLTKAVRIGQMTVQTDSVATPTKSITLAGFQQRFAEDDREPSVQQQVNSLFGYKVKFGTVNDDEKTTLNKAGRVLKSGEEVIPDSYQWQRASLAAPVSVTQLAAYHGKGIETLKWYAGDSYSTTNVVVHKGGDVGGDNQTMLPRPLSGVGVASGSFSPSGNFGFRLAADWSDPTRNTVGIDFDHQNGCPTTVQCGHRLRFFPLRDATDTLVPNQYILIQDYTSPYVNYDYNDNVYLVKNIQPAGTAQTAPQGPVVLRVDAASTTQTTDSQGNIWQPDTGLFEPSGTAIIEGADGTTPISGTEDDDLYRTYRAKLSNNPPIGQRVLTYNLPIPGNSTAVDVRLMWAERYWKQAGKRVFDVYANGTLVISNLDLYATTRDNTAFDSFLENIAVPADRKVKIEFRATADFGAISAIEVRCRTSC